MIPNGPGSGNRQACLGAVQKQSGVLDVRLIGDSLQPMSLAPGVFPGAIQPGQLFRRLIERENQLERSARYSGFRVSAG